MSDEALERDAERVEAEAPEWDTGFLTPHSPTPEPDKDEPDKPDAEPAPIRAWRIAYRDLGTFSMVGTSTADVVRRIEQLKDNFASVPHKLAPVKIMNHGRNRVDTVWIVPANIVGVFGEYEETEEEPDPMSGFQKLMEAAAEQSTRFGVVDVDPPEPNGKGDANDNDS